MFGNVIILDGSGEAISFNDEGSPQAHRTGNTKVHIDAQVNRALSLDWFYKLLALFPDIAGELKSAIIVAKFKELATETRDRIWRSLHRVRIHIVDPRPHYRRIDNIIRQSWRNPAAPEKLRQMAIDGSHAARWMVARMREMVADSVLTDSTAIRVQSLGHALADPFFGMTMPDSLSFLVRSKHESAPLITLEDFGRSGDRDVVRNVASWSAKASAAFHAALDAAWTPDQDDAITYRFDFGRSVRNRISQELLPPHAFDKGNRPHIDLLEQSRQSLIDELSANERFYEVIGKRPGFVEVESKESYYVHSRVNILHEPVEFLLGLIQVVLGRFDLAIVSDTDEQHSRKANGDRVCERNDVRAEDRGGEWAAGTCCDYSGQ
jgi:hypothetical protein